MLKVFWGADGNDVRRVVCARGDAVDCCALVALAGRCPIGSLGCRALLAEIEVGCGAPAFRMCGAFADVLASGIWLFAAPLRLGGWPLRCWLLDDRWVPFGAGVVYTSSEVSKVWMFVRVVSSHLRETAQYAHWSYACRETSHLQSHRRVQSVRCDRLWRGSIRPDCAH